MPPPPDLDLLRGVSHTENSFSSPLAKSLGNFLLRRGIKVMLQVQFYLNRSPQWTLRRILLEFSNIFVKEHPRKASPVAFVQIKIKGFDLNSLF